MKYLFILLLLVAGCSKPNVAPDLTGHWTFSTSLCSGDFTIIKNNGGGTNYPYAVAPSGSFTISGTNYVIGYKVEIATNGTYNGVSNYLVVLSTALNQNNDATQLEFNLATNVNFSSVTGGNPVTYQIATVTGHTGGYFNIKSFPLTRR